MNSFFKAIEDQQKQKKTYLSVGLDPHLEKLPSHFEKKAESIFPFLKSIVDATAPYACAFKPQIAYFGGQAGEKALNDIIHYIHQSHPGIPVIIDAKRNDIGSTAEMYSKEVYERYGADAATVNPYMGGDTIEPFSKNKDKGVFVLCRTSNPGASEFQNITVGDGIPLYTFVAQRALGDWNKNGNIGLVVGATAVSELRKLRSQFSEAWFLIPGVGAQGGDLPSVIQYGTRAQGGGIIINSARGILYASSGEDYVEAARAEAEKLQIEMAKSF